MASVERVVDLSELGEGRRVPATIALRPARFDRVARLYRAMEYLSFGPMLERCRFHHIPAVKGARRALVVGDGDGRFLARLLAAAPHLRADAVDGSSAMLHLLRRRIALQGDLRRITATCADARIFTPSSGGYDLVVTHFFLDCLTERETEGLVACLRPGLVPGARWLVSEFQVPEGGGLRKGLARAVIGGLYAAFGWLTGLRVRRIPEWRVVLKRHGFARRAAHTWLGGLLVSEVWEVAEQPRPFCCPPTEK
ncbi:MAG: class I SAM-dependent methyltransferase [Acidobacteriota bacterium]